MALNRVISFLAEACSLATMGAANATTYTFDFVGTGATSFTYAGALNNGTYITGAHSALTTAAGASTIPSFTLQMGDVVRGSVDLSSSIAVPFGSQGGQLLVYLGDCCFAGVVWGRETLTISDHGGVTSTSLSRVYDGSSSPLAIGMYLSGAASQAFSFDHLDYSLTVTGFTDATSVTVPSGGMYIDYASISPVPEPASAALLAGGLAVVWRRRRR